MHDGIEGLAGQQGTQLLLVTQIGLAPRDDAGLTVSACELVLEGLVAQKRISRSEELGYSRVRPDKPPFGKNPGGGPNLFA